MDALYSIVLVILTSFSSTCGKFIVMILFIRKCLSLLVLFMLASLSNGCTAVSNTLITIEIDGQTNQEAIINDFSVYAKNRQFYLSKLRLDGTRVFRSNKYSGILVVYTYKKKIDLSFQTAPVILFPYPKMTWEHRKFQNEMLKEFSHYKTKYTVTAKWQGNPTHYPDDQLLTMPPPAWSSLIILLGDNWAFLLGGALGLFFIIKKLKIIIRTYMGTSP